jgi:hypothetical protein
MSDIPASDPRYQAPPWPTTQAPGAEPPVIAPSVVPIYRWAPVIALLNTAQLDILDRESAARQVASWTTFNERQV